MSNALNCFLFLLSLCIEIFFNFDFVFLKTWIACLLNNRNSSAGSSVQYL